MPTITARPRALIAGLLAAATAVALVGAALAGASRLARFVPGYDAALGDGAAVALESVEPAGLVEPGSLAPAFPEEGIPTASVVALSQPIPIDPLAPYVVGVTWDEDAAPRIEARSFRDGAWGTWEPLGVDGDSGERPGTESRYGTEPYVVTRADAVQVRAYGDDRPAGLTVRLYSSDVTVDDIVLALDPGSEEAPAPGLGSSRAASGFAAAYGESEAATEQLNHPRLVTVLRPHIHTRDEWRARLPTEWFESTYVEGAAVHHTAGVNDYLPQEVPSILRSIQNLHMDGRKFWDIAYNFLIDRYGGIWEGRAGGVEAAARGAHSHTFNPILTGVSIMGNFQEEPVPGVAINRLVALLAWKLTLHGASAGGILLHEGTWPAIIGHKDIPESATACPGKYLYALLPEIRSRVLAAQHLPAAPFTTDVTGDGTADIASVDGDVVRIRSSGLEAAPSAPFQGTSVAAAFDADYDLMTAGPALDGRGGTDVVARQERTGFLVRMHDLGSGALGPPSVVGDAGGADIVVSPGDVTGDGVPDVLLADASSGALVAAAGDGSGHVGPPVVAARAFGALSAIAPAGDVDGDGNVDLLVLLADGRLGLAHGDGAGGFGPPTILSGDWAGYDELAPVGDLDADGVPDFVAHSSSSGRARTILGAGGGPTGTYTQWRSSDTTWRDPMGAPGWAGDDGATLLARDPVTGDLLRPLPVTTARSRAPADLTFVQPGARRAFVVGDVDHNGLADVATIGADGSLVVHFSTDGGLTEGVAVADPGEAEPYSYLRNLTLDLPPDVPVSRPYWAPTGPAPDDPYPDEPPFWSEYTSVAAAGDIDFDGTPDLVAINDRGDVLVFTWDPDDPSRVDRGLRVARGMADYRVMGVGPWRSGSISDLLAVSPEGDVRLILGRGMTGGRVTGTIATWAPGTVAYALGQVGPDAVAAVAVVAPGDEEPTVYSRGASGDWAALEGG